MFAPLIDTITGRSSAWSATGKAAHMLRVDTAGSSPAYVAQTTSTRPANTTAYTAGDVVGATAAVITLASIGPANGVIEITDVDLRIDVASLPTGMTTHRIHLYNETPPSALADNAAWSLTTADAPYYLGYIDLGQVVDVGDALFVQSDGSGSKVVKMGATTSLFAYRVTNAAYTPTSAAASALRVCAKGV